MGKPLTCPANSCVLLADVVSPDSWLSLHILSANDERIKSPVKPTEIKLSHVEGGGDASDRTTKERMNALIRNID